MAEEPARVTDPALLDVMRELAAREPLFHHPELGSTRAELDRQVAADSWEVGASGRRYSRAHVLDTVLARYRSGVPDAPWEADEFFCQSVAPGAYLLTYDLRQGARFTRRSTLWRRSGDEWQVVYHQGTVVTE